MLDEPLPPAVALPLPPPALPPHPSDAMHTGAFAVTGVDAAADGATVFPLDCTEPVEPSALCAEEPTEAVLAAGWADAEPPVAFPLQPSDAMQTGAFAVTGAATPALGAAVVPDTWADPVACETDCPGSATAGLVMTAATVATTATMTARFITRVPPSCSS